MIESILLAVPIVGAVLWMIYVLDQLDEPGGAG